MKASAMINVIIISIIIAACIALFLVVSSSSQSAEKQGSEEMRNFISDSGLIVEFASADTVTVRNRGTAKAIITGLNMTLGGQPVECIWSQFVIPPGEVASCSLRVNCTGKTVRISGSRDSFVCR